MGFGEAQFTAHDVGALDERDAFVIGDAAGETLTAKAAIGGDYQPLGRNVFERFSDQCRDMLGRLDGGDTMVDHTDTDLLVGLVFGKKRQVTAIA